MQLVVLIRVCASSDSILQSVLARRMNHKHMIIKAEVAGHSMHGVCRVSTARFSTIIGVSHHGAS